MQMKKYFPESLIRLLQKSLSASMPRKIWQFATTDKTVIQNAAETCVKKYESHVFQELGEEIIHLKNTNKTNFEADLPPFRL